MKHITPHGHKRDCRQLTHGKKCNCMTLPQQRRYLAWLEAETTKIAPSGPGAAGAQTQALCPEPGIQQIPCGIAVDVDIETGAGGTCPYRPTHKAALIQGKWLHVCQLHGARLQQAGIVVKVLENPTQAE